ncbi:UNVERIFIED_CONTAM: hypothetical protein PYX00_008942 [Menopon gallinae]|uniref:protein-serine/threonine phosphatase n=1 Tax=Menopon gallinae TaxID=328185 RepID=A0AAW2H9J0_9NEOP
MYENMKTKNAQVVTQEAERPEDELQKRLKEEREKDTLKLQRLAGSNNSRRLTNARDITEIRPYLLLCGALALRGNVLEDLNVTCVVNATNELPDTPLPSDIFYLRVSVDDKSDCDILSWLDTVADLIHQVKLASGKTLIHCVAGISRSATLCLGYLIKYEGYTLFDSYNMLKQLRNIRPNSGFFGQLVEFEKRTTGKQTVLMIKSNYASDFIPHLYEDDYFKFYRYKCMRL